MHHDKEMFLFLPVLNSYCCYISISATTGVVHTHIEHYNREGKSKTVLDMV